MRHRKPPRYRVLWRDLGGDNYACDRADLKAAWREARALGKEAVAWQDIRIHDTKDGVIWTLTQLDGHDFHERTREQVAHRNERDRILQAHGWRVFHFSGSEIHRNPLSCVLEVFDYSASQFQGAWCAIHDQQASA